ncbi:hypothetical protein ACFWIB_03420 [Streptomyces sp. NPDC127051]|uniref:hypothetical protein n=1 Tax=Streptomyces sp. NPDC127051 TaxID=3347119 RepID=UPI003651362B
MSSSSDRPQDGQTVTVRFHPARGPERVYDFTALPHPELHPGLAAALTARIKPVGGTARTASTADMYFASIRRFLSFLGVLDEPLASLGDLRGKHLRQYTASDPGYPASAMNREIAQLCRLLQDAPYGSLDEDLWQTVKNPGHLIRPAPAAHRTPVYSRGEFTALLTAARGDVAQITERVAAGEKLLASFRSAPDSLSDSDRATARVLDTLDRTGALPSVQRPKDAVESAGRLCLTGADLAPLLVLAVGLTGLRARAVHTLPADHTVDGSAVVVAVNGARAHDTVPVHWPLTSDDQAPLHNPGAFYLLLHRLTARSRRFARTPMVWSVWTPGGHTTPPFHAPSALLTVWARRHQLTGDDGRPLTVAMPRIRATARGRVLR